MQSADHYAQILRAANESKKPIFPLRNEIGENNIDLAYQIQDLNTNYKLEQGLRIVGKKIGLTSKAVQHQLGVDQPDFGVLFNDMELLNGDFVKVSSLMQPKAESEIALILSEALDYNNLTIIDLIDCIDYALPAIEIVGSRIQNWDIKIADTIADNASASHYVLGHTPKTLDEFDIVNCNMKLYKNDQIVSEGNGAACLGSPLNAMLWLANKCIEFGMPLSEGDLVLTGALGPMTSINSGDYIRTEIEGLGSVSINFED